MNTVWRPRAARSHRRWKVSGLARGRVTPLHFSLPWPVKFAWPVESAAASEAYVGAADVEDDGEPRPARTE